MYEGRYFVKVFSVGYVMKFRAKIPRIVLKIAKLVDFFLEIIMETGK